MTALCTIGKRVVTPSGDVGVIEEIDAEEPIMARVRLRTPDDEPSVLSSWCFPDQLSDGDGILPMPRSKSWKAEAQAFCLHLYDAVKAAFEEEPKEMEGE